MATAAAAKVLPAAAQAVESFATSSTAAKAGGALARAAITAGGVVHGAMTGNIPEVVLAPMAGWKAGRGGYWLTQYAQKAAAPIASAMESMAPYVEKAVPYLDAAAAMQAEGNSLQRLNTPEHYAAVAKYLVDNQGLTPSAAIKRVTGGDATQFGKVMTAYMKANQTK